MSKKIGEALGMMTVGCIAAVILALTYRLVKWIIF